MNFSFFALRNMLSFGKVLTYTIKLVHPKASVVQIADYETPMINNVDYIIRHKFTKRRLLYNRLEAYILAMEEYGPLIFLDPDMIIIKDVSELNDFLNNYDLIVTKHKKDFLIKNKMMGISFPELTNKKILEVMPYNGGFVACSKIKVLYELKKIYDSLSSEYFFWYGDQIAIKKVIDNNNYNIKILDKDIYNYTPKNQNEKLNDVSIAHFKGRKKELLIEMLPNIFEKNIVDLIFK